MLECWNVGVLECWKTGASRSASWRRAASLSALTERMECWNVGMLECRCYASEPRVARKSSQPWAVRRNAFGIKSGLLFLFVLISNCSGTKIKPKTKTKRKAKVKIESRGVRKRLLSLVFGLLVFLVPLFLHSLPLSAADLSRPADLEKLLTEGGDAIPELIASLDGPNALHAVSALGRIGKPVPLDILLPLLKSKDGEVRAAAAWAVGRCGNVSSAESLIPLTKDPHAPSRGAAFWSLGKLGAYEATETITAGITDPDRNVRLGLVRGIEAGGNSGFFPFLIDRLDYRVNLEQDKKDEKKLVERVDWIEPDAAIRLAVIQALGRLKVIDSLPALIYAMEREVSFNRLAIIQSFERFGTKASGVCLGRIVPTPYDKEAFEERMPLLINNGTLAVIAGRLDDERSIPYLRKTLLLPTGNLGKDKDLTELYIHTVELLGKFKVERASRPLATMLKQTRIKQLSQATRIALRSIGKPAARPLARNAEDWTLAPVFLPLLREPALRTVSLRKTIIRFLAHESAEVRFEATETLGLYLYEGILDEYDIPLFEAMYLDPDRRVRQTCAKWKIKIRKRYGEGSVK